MNKKLVVISIICAVICSFCCACSPQKTDLQDYKDAAKEQITSYVQDSGFNEDEHEYVYIILNECINQIDSSDNKERIDAIVNSVEEKIIKAYKDFAKEQITSYVQNSGYNKEQHGFAYEILNECINQIDSSDNKEGIDTIVNSVEEKIIKAYKDNAKEQITSYVQNFDFNEYMHEYVYGILNYYVNQIDSSDSKEEIDAIVNLKKKSIDAMVNSGEEEIIERYKILVKTQLGTHAHKFSHFYSEELNAAIDEISNKYKSQIDSASNKQEIDFYMNSAKEAIDLQTKDAVKFDRTIEFKRGPSRHCGDVETPQNIIISSRSELEKLLDSYISNWAILEGYDEDYFNENALICCLKGESGGNLKRRVENVYINGEKAFIEITNVIDVWNIGDDGSIDVNTDSYSKLYTIEVRKTDIENIKDIELFFTSTIV